MARDPRDNRLVGKREGQSDSVVTGLASATRPQQGLDLFQVRLFVCRRVELEHCGAEAHRQPTFLIQAIVLEEKKAGRLLRDGPRSRWGCSTI